MSPCALEAAFSPAMIVCGQRTGGVWPPKTLSYAFAIRRHGDELPLEIERLWRTLAHNRRNIIPMLDFLASLGTHMAYQVGGMQPGSPLGAQLSGGWYTP